MLKSAVKGLLLSLSISLGAFAQEIFKLNSFGGGFNVSMGYQGYNPSSYFSDETKIGYDLIESSTSGTRTTSTVASFKKPSSGVLTTGFQGFGVFNSFILGGELNLNIGSPAESEHIDILSENGSNATNIYSTKSRLAGADALVNLGFIAVRKRGLIVYPMLGLGYGMSGLLLSSEAPTRLYPDIASVVTVSDPNLQNIFIWTQTPIFDFGLGAQYMLGASTEDRAKGFSIGLRMGYKLQPETDNIRINANKNPKDGRDWKDAEIPKVDLSGFYVKLLIGFGKVGE